MMTYFHLFNVMKRANLRPAELAERLGVSAMTIRRWQLEPSKRKLAKLYRRAFEGVVYDLIAEGKLLMTDPAIKDVITPNSWPSMSAAVTTLGIKPETLQSGASNQKDLMESLSRLGTHQNSQAEVEKSKARIFKFKKMGTDWSRRVTTLWKVIQSTQLNSFDKLVAYGALFYLIYPFDLIPDYIPVFGYMDDYLMLGFALAYYVKRFPNLFPHLPEKESKF